MINLQNISFNLLDVISIFAVYLMASIYIGATFFCKKMPYFVGYTYLCISISALLINFITAKGLYGDVNKFFYHWGVIGIVGTMIVLMFVFFRNTKEKEKDAYWGEYYCDAKKAQCNCKTKDFNQEQQLKEQASKNNYFDKQKYQQQKANQHLYEQLKENRDKEINQNDIYKAESKGGVYQQQQQTTNYNSNVADNRNFNSNEFNNNYNNAYQNNYSDNAINNRNFGNMESGDRNNINNNYSNRNENYNTYSNSNNQQRPSSNCMDSEPSNINNGQQLSVNENFEKDILSKAQDMLYNSQLPVKQDVDRLKNDISLIHNDVQKIVDRIAQLLSLMSLVLKK